MAATYDEVKQELVEINTELAVAITTLASIKTLVTDLRDGGFSQAKIDELDGLTTSALEALGRVKTSQEDILAEPTA